MTASIILIFQNFVVIIALFLSFVRKNSWRESVVLDNLRNSDLHCAVD